MSDIPDFEAMAREALEKAGRIKWPLSREVVIATEAFERGRASRDASSETCVHFSDAQVRREITRLMREDFDPHPNWPAGQWDDNADDVATKIVALFRSQIATLTQERDEIDATRAQLEAALRDARPYVHSFARYNADKRAQGVCEDIDAALEGKPAP
jgi:hypothetical protein